MLSEEAYNNLIENIHVMENRANYDWLMESKAQLEGGEMSVHELIEVSLSADNLTTDRGPVVLTSITD